MDYRIHIYNSPGKGADIHAKFVFDLHVGLIDFVNALAGLSTSFGLVSIWMITGISQSMNLDTRYIGLASTGSFYFYQNS